MRHSFIFIATLLLLTSCVNNDLDTIGKRFYYYDTQKIYLTESNKQLTVCFPPGTTRQEKQDILSQYPYLSPIEFSTEPFDMNKVDAADMNNVFVSFTDSPKYSTAKNRIEEIKKNPKVRSADLMFCDELNRPMLGLIDQFVVRLKLSTTNQELNDLLAQTKTKILYPSQWDAQTYIISADKYSKGDALDMANRFFETGKFEYAEPNFLDIFWN